VRTSNPSRTSFRKVQFVSQANYCHTLLYESTYCHCEIFHFPYASFESGRETGLYETTDFITTFTKARNWFQSNTIHIFTLDSQWLGLQFRTPSSWPSYFFLLTSPSNRWGNTPTFKMCHDNFLSCATIVREVNNALERPH
jgi:hypothetical protein